MCSPVKMLSCFYLERLFLINPVTLLMKGSGLVCYRGNGSELDGSEQNRRSID